MPDVNQEIEELLIKVSGTNDLQTAEGAFAQLQTALQTGSITFTQFEQATERVDARLATLRAATGSATGALSAQQANVYELADAYEVLGTEQQTVFTSAVQVGEAQARAAQAFSWTQVVHPQVRQLAADFDFASINLGKTGTALQKIGPAGATGSRGMTNLGQSAYIASQGLEDLQYGFRGVINNIPMLVMSLGGSMGVAAALSVVTVGAYQLYTHWDQLTEIFENRRPFPGVAGDLTQMTEKLGKVKEELKGLEKLGTLSVTQFNRAQELQRTEQELAAEVAAGEAVKRLKETKTDKEVEVAKAFEEALKEAGAARELDALAADFKASPNPAIQRAFTTVINALEKGNLDAYNALIDMLEGKFGKSSTFAIELKKLQPIVKLPDINAFEEAAQEAKQANAEAALQLGKDLGRQGEEIAEDAIHEIAERARDGIQEAVGARFQDFLIRTRAGGSKGQKEIEYLTTAIADALQRLFPELEAFPGTIASIATEMARKFQQNVDDAIKQLQETEGLTRREALRRLDMARASKEQQRAEALAGEELAAYAGRQYRREAALAGPGAMPALTPEMQAAMGQEIQDQLQALGVSPREQIQIGKLLNEPQAARMIPGALQALGARGFSEPEALRALPEMFRQLQAGAGGFEQAAGRILNQVVQQQRGAAQQAAVEQRAVVRRPGAGERVTNILPGMPQPAGFQSIPPAPPTGAGPEHVIAIGQAAAGANQATLSAMNEGLVAMQQLTNQLAAQTQLAQQLRTGFRQVVRHTAEQQPTALNNLR